MDRIAGREINIEIGRGEAIKAGICLVLKIVLIIGSHYLFHLPIVLVILISVVTTFIDTIGRRIEFIIE